MGEFGDRIEVFRQQRALALSDLEAIAKGATFKNNGVDTTTRRKSRAEKIVRDIDAIIAAYNDMDE